jgi:acetyltransferase
VILAPAPHVPDLLRKGTAAGARSATIFSAGFEEGPDAPFPGLGEELRAVLRETGLSVSGPNCLGNFSALAQLVTLTEDRPLSLRGGPLALVGQSGGVMIFLNQSLEERGVLADYLITSGNELGLTIADYIAFFAYEAQIKVIIVYIEALKDHESFRKACLSAQAAGKFVIALKLGSSDGGRSAAMAHTGALAGALEAFDALAADCGVIRADTLDDAVELAEYLVHARPPGGPRVGAITLSGAYRGLLLDAGARWGLTFPQLAVETLESLERALGVGSHVSNPVDGGFSILTSEAAYRACIEAVSADPSIDILLIQEALPRAAGSQRAEKYIRIVEEYAARSEKPIAFVTLASHGQSDHSRSLRVDAPHVPFLQEANKALRTVQRVVERDRRLRLNASAAEPTGDNVARAQARDEIRHSRRAGTIVMGEWRSKKILEAYGAPLAREVFVINLEESVEGARRIGYPVVLKGAGAGLHHKTEAGAVMLAIPDEQALRAAWERLSENVRTATGAPMAGAIVAQQAPGGVELVIGLHRDPECGLTFMAGAGGVMLELMKDIAFAAAPLNREKARDMLARTRAAQLICGFRGGPNLDVRPVEDALLALDALAADIGDDLESVEINPLRLTQAGAFALDALVILRPNQTHD